MVDFSEKVGYSKKMTVTTAIIFATAFVILMTIGSFWDLDISRWLTKGSLAEGEYYSTSVFAIVIEVIGSFPIWIAGCFAFALLFWQTVKFRIKTWLKFILCFGFSAAGLVSAFMLVRDILKYLMEQNNLEYFLSVDGVFAAISFLTLTIWLLMIFALKNFKADQKKILGFALVILCTIALYSIISVTKSIVGRVRYRTINFLGDESFFKPWYIINNPNTFANLPDDCCESFPSGHTFSAGIIYVLLCLPSVCKKLNTLVAKGAILAFCVAYTATVAIGRIVAGAHYLTDVTFGGTIPLFGVLLFKRIFLDSKKLQNKEADVQSMICTTETRDE